MAGITGTVTPSITAAAKADLKDDELYVLSGAEIQSLVLESFHLGAENGKKLAKELATPINEVPDYGFCYGCGGERYRS